MSSSRVARRPRGPIQLSRHALHRRPPRRLVTCPRMLCGEPPGACWPAKTPRVSEKVHRARRGDKGKVEGPLKREHGLFLGPISAFGRHGGRPSIGRKSKRQSYIGVREGPPPCGPGPGVPKQKTMLKRSAAGQQPMPSRPYSYTYSYPPTFPTPIPSRALTDHRSPPAHCTRLLSRHPARRQVQSIRLDFL
jgi:hypothetical protein